MAEILKVLAQVAPAATTLTDTYTVPAATSTVVSTLIVCNRNSSGSSRYRVSVAPAGAADAVAQYLFWDVKLSNRNSQTFTLGLTLAATDVVRVYAEDANLSFSLYGTEVS